MTDRKADIEGLVLCATMRCGSTMICEDFWNAEVLGHPEEYFIPWIKNSELPWKKSFSNIQNKAKGENGFKSIKVMATQLREINNGLSVVAENEEYEGDPFFHVFRNFGFVLIKRNDIVKQGISRFLAQSRTANHLKNGEGIFSPGGAITVEDFSKENKVFEFKPERIATHIANIACENAYWESILKKHNIDYLTVEYEPIVKSSTTDYLNSISEYFGLESVGDVYEKRTLRKIGNHVNQEFHEKMLHSITTNRNRK